MKAGVLSRGRSHASKDMVDPVPKGMARGGIGPAARQSGVEACLSLPAKEVRGPSSLVRAFRDKGQGPIWVKGGDASLPARMWDWLSGDGPHSPKDWWPNKPLEGHRGAIVAALQGVSCEGPEG